MEIKTVIMIIIETLLVVKIVKTVISTVDAKNPASHQVPYTLATMVL